MERDWGLESPAPDPVTVRRLTNHAALGPSWAAILEQPTARLRSLALAKHLAEADARQAVATIDDACSFAQAGGTKHRAAFETVLDFAFSGDFDQALIEAWSPLAMFERRMGCAAILELARYREAIQAHVLDIGLERFTRLALRPVLEHEDLDLETESEAAPEVGPEATQAPSSPHTGLFDEETHPGLLFPLARRYVNLSAGIDPRSPGLGQAKIRAAARELVIQLAEQANALLLLGIASGPWRRHTLVRSALLRHGHTPKPIKEALRAGSHPRAARPQRRRYLQ